MFISGDPGLSPFFWLNKGNGIKEIDNCLLFSHARGALNYYLNRLKLGSGKKEWQILLPDYICDDLVRAIKKAGFEVSYYNINEDLRPDENDIIENITDKTLAILVVHYFGFYIPIDDIASYCRQKGVYVIDDCAHVLFYDYKTAYRIFKGDAAIFSLRKIFPIPDGGLLFARDMKINAGVLDRYKIKSLGLTKFYLKYILSRIIISPARDFGGENYIDGSFHDIKGISSISETILKNHVDTESIKKRRRRNFFYYIKRLKESNISSKVEPLFYDLKEFEVPYMFPLRLRHSNKELVMNLRKQGVPAISWPSLPDEVRNSARHSIAKELQDKILLLPLHQDIDNYHIDYIVHKLYQFI